MWKKATCLKRTKVSQIKKERKKKICVFPSKCKWWGLPYEDKWEVASWKTSPVFGPRSTRKTHYERGVFKERATPGKSSATSVPAYFPASSISIFAFLQRILRALREPQSPSGFVPTAIIQDRGFCWQSCFKSLSWQYHLIVHQGSARCILFCFSPLLPPLALRRRQIRLCPKISPSICSIFLLMLPFSF